MKILTPYYKNGKNNFILRPTILFDIGGLITNE